MTESIPKKLSRRDAIKILGAAAGASVLANLPSKWSKPELTSGVLPAHAATSAFAPVHTLTCGTDGTLSLSGTPFLLNPATSSVTIAAPAAGIVMKYSISISITAGTGSLVSPAATGTATTNGSGVASIVFQVTTTPAAGFGIGKVSITWSFQNPADGVTTCVQQFNWSYVFIP